MSSKHQVSGVSGGLVMTSDWWLTLTFSRRESTRRGRKERERVEVWNMFFIFHRLGCDLAKYCSTGLKPPTSLSGVIMYRKSEYAYLRLKPWQFLFNWLNLNHAKKRSILGRWNPTANESTKVRVFVTLVPPVASATWDPVWFQWA